MGDALIDLVYVALGTADLMGLPWEKMFEEVQRANMAKERAKSADESMAKTGRGHVLDVVKPAGWTPPDHLPILTAASIMIHPSNIDLASGPDESVLV
jgi:predicted HAD superfamily Cof-like phosphohydrolase